MSPHRTALPARPVPARRALAALVAILLSAAPLAAGTPQLKVYFAADFTDQAYQQKSYTKVATAWKRPAGAPKPGSKAVVTVSIARDGRGLLPALHMKSGSDAWDAAALTAVTKASPFDPLPASYKGASVEVHFHFEYNK
ncbi:MAG TPA: energy transducer TonB [Candidatus Polarisedimenticolia bacterium]|nr:energy transducer TonB [Candidatus Polarisedimenticolia bacterium]